ncbi:hypothetical protein TNCV_2398791 [Trichonephila clavipes]|uniref:Uncharacterized protein n=1 Tax=Trichonephila clavipes TaxID=2585209 RepID=A0A8X6VRA0_TRICX|nr:hypothetical protein TNCV_2398791 [Trichonephila clavipes]
MSIKSVEALCHAVGVVWSLWYSTSSGIILVTSPRLKITRSVANNPRVALYCAALTFTHRALEAWREN